MTLNSVVKKMIWVPNQIFDVVNRNILFTWSALVVMFAPTVIGGAYTQVALFSGPPWSELGGIPWLLVAFPMGILISKALGFLALILGLTAYLYSLVANPDSARRLWYPFFFTYLASYLSIAIVVVGKIEWLPLVVFLLMFVAVSFLSNFGTSKPTQTEK